ncbi:hypothetical protein SASPL_127860 [Salvia splendens]|uniref:DUF659 domain-containing protein n=1 Tax=Salvia splendens TaxID=180675 RepID=A0A8X8XCY0_SALSN|nr:uncharacterized protein LOC121752499 [Salvia splendens]XP_042003541.1 uncharacterized protein LOC121752499 [Salvia splendens]XP_042003542.1 uncharacterized protein LOC121752499 [Salvia splendens]XP_042003543.1 uncharacterized protein LOC121752499 [Salvia splendens]KAG6409818.1 hypothetical protein SASPL_127860 [Salvia splendens]
MDRRGLTLIQGPIDESLYRSASSSQNIAVESTSYLSPTTATSSDSLNREFKLHIGRFFYENRLDFDAASSTSFKSMISLFSRRGIQCQAPTVEELKGWIFRDVMKEATSRVDEIKRSWAVTGCSILLDGWTYANDRTFVNVLVDSPKGTVYLSSSDITTCVGNMEAMQTFLAKVLAEVGLHNVVQIVSYSSSAFMMEAGRQLMERYRPIFWTVSASHCIELILENLATMDIIHETLEKAKIISSFVHNHPIALKYLQDQTNGSGLVDSSRISTMRPFLMLENIVIKKGALKKMFSFSHSQSSNLMSTVEGRKASELVADRSFWIGASTILKGAIPVVRVIEWMDKSGRVHMGYIYEIIDQAKETIKQGFKKKSEYMPFWDAIDDVWNKCLYSPLHSTGYYFNPNLFYTSDAYIDSEVVTGMSCFIVRSAADFRMQDQLVVQMELYRTGRGGMGAGVPEEQRSNLSPALWWSRYGGECPELQRRMIRLLSQTCDGAARYQLRRSLAETLLTKGGNEDEQKWARDMVFLGYNMHLQNFVIGSSVSDDANS